MRPCLSLWLFLPALVAAPRAVSGQDTWRIGPRVGMTVSVMRFADRSTEGQTEALIGFQAGIAIQRDLSRFAGVEVDVLLTREGFTGTGAHTGNLVMDYIAIPVLLRLRTSTGTALHLTLGGSGRLGLRCRQTEVPIAGALPCDDPVMGARWSRVDASANVGAGVALPWSGRRLLADALLSWGLRDRNDGLYVPGAAHSVSIAFTLAWLSPLAGRGGGQ